MRKWTTYLIGYLVVERPEEDPEELPEVHVVRRLLKTQPAAVVEVHGKLCWEPLAQHLKLSIDSWQSKDLSHCKYFFS